MATVAATMHTADAREIRLGPATFDKTPDGKAQMTLGLATFSQADDGGVKMQVGPATVHRTLDGKIEASVVDEFLDDPTAYAVEELTGMTTQQIEDMMAAGELVLEAVGIDADALDDEAKAWVSTTSKKLEGTLHAAAEIMTTQVEAYAKQAAAEATAYAKKATADATAYAKEATAEAAIDATAYAKEATAEAMVKAQDQANKLKPKVLAAGKQKADDVQVWAVNMGGKLKAWADQKTTELKPMLDREALIDAKATAQDFKMKLEATSKQVLADAKPFFDEGLNKLAAEVTNAGAASKQVLYDVKRQADDELKPKLAEEGKKAMAQVTSWFNDKAEAVGVAVEEAFGTEPEAFIKEVKEKFEAAVKK